MNCLSYWSMSLFFSSGHVVLLYKWKSALGVVKTVTSMPVSSTPFGKSSLGIPEFHPVGCSEYRDVSQSST